MDSSVVSNAAKIVPKLQNAMAFNSAIGAVEVSQDNFEYKLTQVGISLLSADPQGVAFNMLRLAVFGMQELADEVNDNAVGGFDDILRDVAHELEQGMQLAEFVVTVLINGACAKFGTALTTIMGAMAHCNIW